MDGVAVAAALLEVVNLVKAGSGANNPYRSAVNQVKKQFPTFKNELPASFDAFLKDDEVASALSNAISNQQASSVVAFLGKRFTELATIPSLTQESATDIVRSFASDLASTLLDPTSGTGLLHHAIHDEGAKTRSAVRQELDQFKQEMMISRDHLPVPASLNAIGEDADHDRDDTGPWASRLREAKRLLDSGNASASRAIYTQILSDAIRNSVTDKDLLYRLHYNIGVSSTALEDYEAAERSFDRTLRVRPKDADANAMLAQALLLRGDHSKARARAKDVVTDDPDNRVAWLVLARVAPDVREIGDLTDAVSDNPHVLLSLASSQLDEGRNSSALATTKAACEVLGASVQCHVMAAELLLYLCMPGFGEAMSDRNERVIDGLVEDALSLINAQRQTQYHARALACRAALRFRKKDVAGGTEDASLAYEMSPESREARLAYVYSLALVGTSAKALHVLDGLPKSRLDATELALRAELVADNDGTDEDVTECIKQALSEGGAGLPALVKIGLADVATRRRLAMSRGLIDDIKGDAPPFMVEVLEARVCLAAGDIDQALRHYERALTKAMKSMSRPVAFEYAFCAGSAGRYDEMVRIIDAVGLEGAPDEIYRGYCEALTELGRWDKVAQVADTMGNEGRMAPEWLVHLRAVVAIRLDDYPKAIRLLRILRETCTGELRDDVDLRLAYALWRNGEREEALEFLRELAEKTDLAPAMQGELAKLLSRAGDHDRAIRVAYMVMRASAPSTDYDHLYTMIFFRSPEEIVMKEVPARVGPDTWVSLESDSGETTELWLLSDAYQCRAHQEISASSDEAQTVLGSSVGATVQIRPKDMVPTDYRVTEIATIWVQAYREALARSAARASAIGNPIQLIPLGDVETVEEFTALVAVLERQRERGAALEEVYQAGKMPLSVLSTDRGSSYIDTYHHASTLPTGILVEGGSAESIEDGQLAVEAGDSVVLHISGLVTLWAIDMLSLPRRMFERVIVPVSLKHELQADLDQTSFDIGRGEAKRLGLFDGTIHATTIPREVLKSRQKELHRLIRWIDKRCVQTPRVSATLGAGDEQLRDTIGASSYDAYALAGGDMPLYADDLALRLLAQGERRAATFSTYSLVTAAVKAGILSGREGWAVLSKLIDLNHQFVPVSADYIHYCVVTDGEPLGELTRKCLQRLVAGSVESSAPVFGTLIRILSTSVVVDGVIVAIVRYVLALLRETKANYRMASALYRVAARHALMLHPLVRDVVDAEFDVYG